MRTYGAGEVQVGTHAYPHLHRPAHRAVRTVREEAAR